MTCGIYASICLIILTIRCHPFGDKSRRRFVIRVNDYITRVQICNLCSSIFAFYIRPPTITEEQ